MESALEALHQQRERERAMGKPRRPPPVSAVAMTPAGLITVPTTPDGALRPPLTSVNLEDSGPESAAAAAATTAASSLTASNTLPLPSSASPAPALQSYGAGWLLEAQERQSRLDRLELEAEHFRVKLVRERLAAKRLDRLRTIWRAWWGLRLSTQRRQDGRLAKMAASIVATASTGTPDRLQHHIDHAEWWERSPSPKKGKRAPVNRAAMV